ncbi:MAG: anhydro-N-acetylmuramic acid kinase [Bacteroidota bacterium]
MTGTSLDGLDAAFCEFWQEEGQFRFDLIDCHEVPIPDKWQARLEHLPYQDAETFAKTHVYWGHWLGEQTRNLIQQFSWQPDFVAVHGQTIFHQPEKSFTAQIGDGESLVSYISCPVVTNFRSKNVALGGQGAPLVPFGEQHLFPDYDLFLNLGGFANVSFQGSGFDVAACNLISNRLAREISPEHAFDPEGTFAAAGNLDPDLLSKLNQLPFYRQSPPKSLGTEWIQAKLDPILHAYPGSLKDLLNTYQHHLAQQIAQALSPFSPRRRELVVTGGGAHNRFFMELLENNLRKVGVDIASDIPKWWINYKEAIIFAFLGYCTLQGVPNTLLQEKESSQLILGGSIHLPSDGKWYLRKTEG